MAHESIRELTHMAPSLATERKFSFHPNLLVVLLETNRIQPETLDNIIDAYKSIADVHANYCARTLLALSVGDTQYRLILHAADAVTVSDLSKAEPVAKVLEVLSTSLDPQREELLEHLEKQSFRNVPKDKKLSMMAAYFPISYDAVLHPEAYVGTILEQPSMQLAFLYASIAHEYYTRINDSAIAISTSGLNSPIEHESKAKIAEGLLMRLEEDYFPNVHPDVAKLREFTWQCLATPRTS